MHRFLILSCLFCIAYTSLFAQQQKPRVFVFTDINIGGGDPDDRQSLVHLLWYSDELDIQGIVPDRWNKQGLEACQEALEAYALDYATYSEFQNIHLDPNLANELLAKDLDDAAQLFRNAIAADDERPIYVLVWGNMVNAAKIILDHAESMDQVRLITIGTGLKYGPEDEVPGKECDVPNWNGPGRNAFFDDPKTKDLWWLEINWTYNGMFTEPGPKAMFDSLAMFGHMGQHIRDVTKDHEWAQYFRVGDTPSVLYLIDPEHSPEDPTKSSWAGKFKQPFPQERPNYYTDDNGPVPWNYEDPCATWEHLQAMYAYNKSTLEKQRPAMYKSLLEKLNRLYSTTASMR
jgi:hypothetical protein